MICRARSGTGVTQPRDTDISVPWLREAPNHQIFPPPPLADHRPGTVHTARTEAGQHNRSPSQTGRRPLQGRTLRERHHRSDGRTCRGDRCRARHGRLRACHWCRLPAAPRYRPRGHGAGRAAAGRIRPRHQGHRADAQEPADRGHQGDAGWGYLPGRFRHWGRGRPGEGRSRPRDQAEAPGHLQGAYGRGGRSRRCRGDARREEGRHRRGLRREGRGPAADRDPRSARPTSEDSAPTERRRRRATAEAGSPETVAAEATSEPKAEAPVQAAQPQGEARGDAGDQGGEGRQGRRRPPRARRPRPRPRRPDRDRDRDRRSKGDDQQGGPRAANRAASSAARSRASSRAAAARTARTVSDRQDDDDFERRPPGPSRPLPRPPWPSWPRRLRPPSRRSPRTTS